MQAAMSRSLIALFILGCTGCASDSGQPSSSASAGASAMAAVTPAVSMASEPAGTFTQVYEMIFPRVTNAHCDMCHGLPPYDLSNGNLSTGMDKASTYAALVGKSSTSSLCKDKLLVDPGKPASSLLLQKLLPNPPCGLRMPNGRAGLSDVQIELVRSWI